MNSNTSSHLNQANTHIGKLSGKAIYLPTGGVTSLADLAPTTYPDCRSFQRKFSLLLPATNTTMEHELWSIIFANQGSHELAGVGLHTSPVMTPKPDVSTPKGIEQYRQQFIDGLENAVKIAKLAEPQYMIMGMSLEHIITGLDNIRATMTKTEQYSDLSWATWHDAIKSALNCYNGKRIGLLTPFEENGTASAARMFSDLGFEVVAAVGLACGNTQHIAHIPDWAKEKAIFEMATAANKLDAIVQCGTNMGMINVAQKLEPVFNIPILGINTVLFWYALRECGLTGALQGGGRLLKEF